MVKAKFSYNSSIRGWPVLKDAVICDTFINVPVLKHHSLTKLTLSMKNLMGVCGGVRGLMHVDIGNKLVDITDFISPDLTVIDATRVLMRHGPSGGKVSDVRIMNKVVVSTDPVLADAFACSLVNVKPSSVPYIDAAIKRGFGNTDVSRARIEKITV